MGRGRRFPAILRHGPAGDQREGMMRFSRILPAELRFFIFFLFGVLLFYTAAREGQAANTI